MIEFFTHLKPCLIGAEEAGSAHYWARKLHALGHTVKLMALQFVKPGEKINKTDAAKASPVTPRPID
ncbi:MAG: transposase [Paraglaciecola psychrophila]|jgi:transposase